MKEGFSPETLKISLKRSNKDPAMVDEVLNESKGKLYKKPIFIALIVFSIIIIGAIVFMVTRTKTEESPKLFVDSFERDKFSSELIIAVNNQNYSSEDYLNVPLGWKVMFRPSGEFQWVSDVYQSGNKSIRLSNPGVITAVRQFDVSDLDKRFPFILYVWIKSNNLTNGFGYVDVNYINSTVENPMFLMRTGKIVGSNDWSWIKIPLEIPTDATKLILALKLYTKDSPLYGKLPTIYDNTTYDPALPSETIWFDSIRLMD